MEKGVFSKLPVRVVEASAYFIEKDFKLLKRLLNKIDADVLEKISRDKALDIFYYAAKNVPAYKEFLKRNKVNIDKINSMDDFDSEVPISTKENYIKKYSYESRCLFGKFPEHGNIDESSGSSGKPTEWIRSKDEEERLRQAARFEYFYSFKPEKKKYILIGAWSMGAWATGVKFAELVEDFALIKSTGPDIGNILDTIKIFGNKYSYLIAGYPPFLKTLVDEGSKRLDWKKYNIDLVTGGEGFVEGWRDYMKKKLSNPIIISSYGSSDIDIAVAFETPLSIYIRRRCNKDKKLRKALFGSAERLPMVFQYDPTQHYIKNTTNKVNGKNVSEFHVTLLDKKIVSPKVKYNIHDEGGVLKFNDVVNILETCDKDFFKKFGDEEDILRLPLVYVYGRSDGTVSVDGANVYPDQIDMCIKSDKKLSEITNSFKIEVKQDIERNIEFRLIFELAENVKNNPGIKKKYHDVIVKKLCEINRDFKESYSKNKKVIDPIVEVYDFGRGVFSKDKEKIKNKYIIKKKDVLNYALIGFLVSIFGYFGITNNLTGASVYSGFEITSLNLFNILLSTIGIFTLIIGFVYYSRMRKMKLIG
ncbi:MAG: hypothetical protein AABW46_01795 [Nanoarchaeota archaeon]